MFSDIRYRNKRALLMSNNLNGCKKDLENLEEILYTFDITKKINCYPKQEIIKFLQNNKSDDLIYIHYSGHGVKRGKKINGKMEILTCWVNPNNTVVSSDQIDFLLSNVNCDIIMTTDCCHSQTFGQYYTGRFPYIFIGTSLIGEISKSSVIDGGSLVNTFQYLIKNNIIINIQNVDEYHVKLFKKKLIIKILK